jgi:hypothetical protein
MQLYPSSFSSPSREMLDVLDSSETIRIPCLELGGKLNFYHLVAENGIVEFCSNSNYVHNRVQTVDRAGE